MGSKSADGCHGVIVMGSKSASARLLKLVWDGMVSLRVGNLRTAVMG